MNTTKPVLVLGSAPNVMASRYLPKSFFSSIVAINNAWQVRDDWDYHIAPDDFAQDRMPQGLSAGQALIRSDAYVPANNAYGGIIYAGATMAFTAGYWVLSALRPSAIIFWGCDMMYPAQGKGHFYGAGTADPLRDDVTLRNLEAKSARLMQHAAMQGCACLRAPEGDSRLVFPTVDVRKLSSMTILPALPDPKAFQRALQQEAELGYFVRSGRYWDSDIEYSGEALDTVDQMWIEASQKGGAALDGMRARA
ncbi:hypothetical protein [Tateyamaria pelophila]|uniref:hypothetical protein n=1 Tax=Tateyamaria pelophila TaxID=328415 RepID=UPI001CBE7F89|nr:hypothetical protein [Tateyamaria pelophila]